MSAPDTTTDRGPDPGPARGPRARVLVVFHSNFGHVETLARAVTAGATRTDGPAGPAEVRLRSFPSVTESSANVATMGESATRITDAVRARTHDVQVATHEDLTWADAIAWGTPSFFGAASVELQMFLETTGPLWFSGALIDKPAGVFVSVGSIHGGHETAVITTMISLLHHGMVLVGTPYVQNPSLLSREDVGGSPYGPSTLASPDLSRPVADEEIAVARNLGQRLAQHGSDYACRHRHGVR